MTAKELRELIKELPDEMLITYEYDSGYSYPTFNSGKIRHVGRDDINPHQPNWPDGQPYTGDKGYCVGGYDVFVLNEYGD